MCNSLPSKYRYISQKLSGTENEKRAVCSNNIRSIYGLSFLCRNVPVFLGTSLRLNDDNHQTYSV